MEIFYKNTRIFYGTKGTGNPIVLLHGFLESSNIWRPYISELSTNRQVIWIDLPGHGQSGNISKVHSMELMADVVYKVLQHLQIKKAAMVGHSLGGYVCLAFCEFHPTMTSSLILMNSTPEEDSEERKENRKRAIKLIYRNKEAYIKMAISNLLTPENNQKFEKDLGEIKNEALHFSSEGITAALEGMKIRTDRFEVLKNFSRQKIIIAGEKDPVLDFKTLKIIALETGCEIISLPDGHLSYLENFKAVCHKMYFID